MTHLEVTAMRERERVHYLMRWVKTSLSAAPERENGSDMIKEYIYCLAVILESQSHIKYSTSQKFGHTNSFQGFLIIFYIFDIVE
jgi:hypothetical protein